MSDYTFQVHKNASDIVQIPNKILQNHWVLVSLEEILQI